MFLEIFELIASKSGNLLLRTFDIDKNDNITILTQKYFKTYMRQPVNLCKCVEGKDHAKDLLKTSRKLSAI